MNKNGYSIGFTWIFALVSMFGLGLLYIVFSQVYSGYLVPTIKNIVLTSIIDVPTQNVIIGNIDKYMVFFNAVPFILFFCIIIYMIVVSVRKEKVDDY